MSSNLAVLTHSHKIIASKKRAKKAQIKDVLFDEDARRDFLTGFHKRKLQKKEEAKKKAIDREKQERLEARREKRQMLAERAAQNAEEVEKAYGAIVGDNESADEAAVLSSGHKGKEKALEIEDEYEDEEQMATVTVVEDFDPEELIHGPDPKTIPTTGVDRLSSSLSSKTTTASKQISNDKTSADIKKSRSKVGTKAKDIKYQTSAARKVERTKQRRRKTEKAERAGGKGSRKKAHGRSKR